MDTGSNKSLFTLLAVVIFGIFLSLSYWLFQDELVEVLANVMDSTSEMTSIKLDNNGLIPTDLKYFDYEIVNGTVTIKEFLAAKGEVPEVVIPAYIDNKPVTTIGKEAFYNKGITSVAFPETLLRIDDGTYENGGSFAYNNIKEVNLPDNLTYVGADAFYGSKVEKLIIGDSVTHLGKRAFKTNNLNSVTFNNNLVILSSEVFRGNLNLSVVNLPKSVTFIGSLAFTLCNIKDFNVPENVTTLGSRFLGSNPLERITIPKNLQAKILATPVILGELAPPYLTMTPEESFYVYDSIVSYY